jgi:E3 ubiquitin-protein ligase MARCH6
MWGNLDEPQMVENDGMDVVELALGEDAQDDAWVDEPVIELADGDLDIDGDLDGEDPPMFDQEAVEDMEDFEGIMELIGMRGPIAGLFQNAIFCAVLVTVTIFAATFIPYNVGRITLWILAHPIRLVRMIIELSKLLQDAVILVGGFLSWCFINLIDTFTQLIGGVIGAQVLALRKMSWNLWIRAGSRMLKYLADFPVSASEVQNFSAISHQSLVTVQTRTGDWFLAIKHVLSLFAGDSAGGVAWGRIWSSIISSAQALSGFAALLFSKLVNPSSWVIDLGAREAEPITNPELTHWSGLDRFWAILTGYITIFFMGAMYLKRNAPFSSANSPVYGWEVVVIDTFHQASGIMKVIFVISIEMLVFPLYCGLLLDAALLPLFEGASFKSRSLFTYNYPLTSVFVHWFVGTGYMFHFALFVSMCRKIMRPGVLCKLKPLLLYVCY